MSISRILRCLIPAPATCQAAQANMATVLGAAGVTRADIHWKNLQPRTGPLLQAEFQNRSPGGFFHDLSRLAARMNMGPSRPPFTSPPCWAANSSASPAAAIHRLTAVGMETRCPCRRRPLLVHPSGTGLRILGFNPKTFGRAPYDSAWNIGVQRQLPWDMFVKASYVGNRAIHVPSSLHQPEQPNPSILHYGSLLGELATSPDAVAAGIKIPYPGWVEQFGGTGTVIQTLIPFPQYSDIYNTYETDGTAFYNGATGTGGEAILWWLELPCRFDALTETLPTESVGSTLFQPNPINSFDMPPEFTPSALDQKYIANLVATYALPFGYGQEVSEFEGNIGRSWPEVGSSVGF